MTKHVLNLTLLVVGLQLSAKADDWPQFRGPNQDGVARSENRFASSQAPRVDWKIPLPGQGWSQPIVVGDTIYVTAALPDVAIRPTSLTAGPVDRSTIRAHDKPPVPDVTIDWQLLAIGLTSGQVKWTRTVKRGKPEHPIHPSNTYATETPAADQNAVYAFFGMSGTLAAFSHEGNELWRREFGAGPVDQGHGTASSLATHDGKLYVPLFRDDIARLLCLNTKTGSTIWQSDRPKPITSWSTPLVWKNRLRTEVVAGAGKLTIGHDANSGEELWRIERVDSPQKPTPTATPEGLFFGYRLLNGTGTLYAIDAGVAGDNSPIPGEKKLARERWSLAAAAPSLASPLVAAGHVYSIGGSILSCIDAATGELKYRQRLPEMNTVETSPIAVDGIVIIIDEDGKMLFLKAGPAFEVVATLNLEEMVWASPAICGDRLLIRTVDHLICLRSNNSP